MFNIRFKFYVYAVVLQYFQMYMYRIFLVV